MPSGVSHTSVSGSAPLRSLLASARHAARSAPGSGESLIGLDRRDGPRVGRNPQRAGASRRRVWTTWSAASTSGPRVVQLPTTDVEAERPTVELEEVLRAGHPGQGALHRLRREPVGAQPRDALAAEQGRAGRLGLVLEQADRGCRSRPSAPRRRSRSRPARPGRAKRRGVQDGGPRSGRRRRRRRGAWWRPPGARLHRRGSAPSQPAGQVDREAPVGQRRHQRSSPSASCDGMGGRVEARVAGLDAGGQQLARRPGRPGPARPSGAAGARARLGDVARRRPPRPSRSRTCGPRGARALADHLARSDRRPARSTGRRARGSRPTPRSTSAVSDAGGRQVGHGGGGLGLGAVGDDHDAGGGTGERGVAVAPAARPRTCRTCRTRWRGRPGACCGSTPATATRAAPPVGRAPARSAAATEAERPRRAGGARPAPCASAPRDEAAGAARVGPARRPRG